MRGKYSLTVRPRIFLLRCYPLVLLHSPRFPLRQFPHWSVAHSAFVGFPFIGISHSFPQAFVARFVSHRNSFSASFLKETFFSFRVDPAIPFSVLLSDIEVKFSTHKLRISCIAIPFSTFRIWISNISICFSWSTFQISILTNRSSKRKIQFSNYENWIFHDFNSKFQFQSSTFHYNKMNFPQFKFIYIFSMFIFPYWIFSLL